MKMGKRILTLITLMIVLIGCSSSTIDGNSVRRQSTGGSLDVSCIGPASASTFVVYLHGMDSINPSPQELRNRSLLEEIAKNKNIRFAVPRAKMQCPTQSGSICWGWKFDQTELSAILPLIIDSRSACFAADKPFTLLGFSNGGYLLMRWYSAGMNPYVSTPPISLIASGSEKAEIKSEIYDLSKNPSLTLLIGKQDQFNFDPAHLLFNQLKTLKAPVQLIEFQGGHILDADSVRKAL